MKVVAIIQARLGSTRFPRKVLAQLWGDTVLGHVVRRTQQIAGIDQVVVACPHGDRDEIAAAHDVVTFSAQALESTDVLGRYATAAGVFGADVVVRITSDCPAFNVDLAEDLIRVATKHQAIDLASSACGQSSWPDGWDVEVFKSDLLNRADRAATGLADREHVTPWMYRETPWQRMYNGHVVPNLSHRFGWRYSIDTPEDLARLEAWGPPS